MQQRGPRADKRVPGGATVSCLHLIFNSMIHLSKLLTLLIVVILDKGLQVSEFSHDDDSSKLFRKEN